MGEAGVFDLDKSGVPHTRSKVVGVSRSKDSAENLFFNVLVSGARHGIEIGTNVGVSSGYIGTALAAAGEPWSLVTLEASPYRIHLARELHGSIGLGSISYVQSLFYDLLAGAVSASPVEFDFAFIDGQHQEQPTIDFMNIICRKIAPTSLFVFDEILGQTR